MNLVEVTYKDISEFKGYPNEFVELLNILVHCEIEKCSPRDVKKVAIPKAITIADAGADGIVEFESGTIFNSQWLKNQHICFQAKASKIGATQCYSEIMEGGIKPKVQSTTTKKATKKGAVKAKKSATVKRKLKSQVELCFSKDGEYILITTDKYGTDGYKQREDSFRNAVKDSGNKNYKKVKIRVFDCQILAKWCNEHLAARTYVKHFCEQPLPNGFKNWELWRKSSGKEKMQFATTTDLSALTQKIIDDIVMAKHVRLIGHSGIGKSRLIRETFNPNSGNEWAKLLSRNLVYVNLEEEKTLNIENFVSSYANLNGLLVIDNCNENTHNQLVSIISDSDNLKIITMDHSLEGKKNAYVLSNENQREVVREILKTKFASYTSTQIDQLLNLSDGYPRMAEHIIVAIDEGGIKDFELPFEKILAEFVKTLIFGRKDRVDKIYYIIQAASLFKDFGAVDAKVRKIADKRHEEMEEAHGNFIASEVCVQPVKYQEFRDTIRKLKNDRAIFKRKYFTYYVVPEPLAANLAAEWLLNFPLTTAQEFAGKLKKVGLLDSFCQRLETLNEHKAARPIVEKLMAHGSPFTTAEELNTNMGSRIFRSLASVDPEGALRVLSSHYLGASSEDLIKVTDARRSLIYILQKLCFRSDLFLDAAKILAEFARAENETWGNNATHQFCELFHIYLPGTEADLNKRIALANDIIDLGEDYIKLITSALAHGLKFDGFHRMGGAERQSPYVTLVDYHPTHDEIVAYWTDIVAILKTLANKYPNHLKSIKETLMTGLYPMIKWGNGVVICDATKEVFATNNELWEKLIDKLMFLTSRDEFNEKEKLLVGDLVSFFKPDDLGNKLRLGVSYPSHRHKFVDGNFIDLQELDAEILASGIAEDVSSIYPYLPDLSRGIQRQGYNFGKKLAELIKPSAELVQKLIEAVEKVDEKEQSVEVLAGLLISESPERKREILRQIANNQKIRKNIFYLTRVWLLTKEDIFYLFQFIDSKEFSITIFENFLYGKLLDSLGTQGVIDVAKKVYSYREGKWTGLGLLAQYCGEDLEKWKECIPTIVNFISNHNHLTEQSTYTLSNYYWTNSIINSLTSTGAISKEEQKQFARVVSNHLIEYLKNPDANLNDFQLKEVAQELVDDYFEVFFEELKPVILNAGIGHLNVKDFLGCGIFAGQKDILFSNKNEYPFILKFCKKEGIKAAYGIMDLLTVHDFADGVIGINKLAMALIEEFPNDKKLFVQFAHKIGQGGMVASFVQYWEDQVERIAPLLSHKNSNIRANAKRHHVYLLKQVEEEKIKADNSD